MHASAARVFTAALLGAAAVYLAGCAADTAKSTDDRLARAEATYKNFRADPEMKWFRDNVGRARAVVIVPGLARAGFIIGGSGGEAIVLAKDKGGGAWAGPAFYNMGTASVGLLAGADVSEVVIIVLTEKALDALMSS